jgi:hypothetical protein
MTIALRSSVGTGVGSGRRSASFSHTRMASL